MKYSNLMINPTTTSSSLTRSLTLLAMLVSCCLVSAREDLIDFQLGYYVDDATIYAHDSLYYRLIVGDDYLPGEDIIVKILPLDYDSDPDIYISKVI